MSKSITIKVYADPSHAWGSVKVSLIKDLGLVDQISRYSYIKGKTVNCEEDCDLSLVVRTLKDRGYTVSFDEKHSNKSSPIRSYPSYNAQLIK